MQTILVCDDDKQIVEAINIYLTGEGFNVIKAYDGYEALDLLAENEVNLIVNVVPWEKHASYDRLGLEDQYTELLGVKIPTYTIPISPGRNLAVILEVAAMNNRQRKMGYNPAKEFTEQMNRHFMENASRG